MTQKLIHDLAIKNQFRIVPILVSQGDLKYKNINLPREHKYTFDNCDPAPGILDMDPSINEDHLNEYRALFPPGRRAANALVQGKAHTFMRIHTKYTFEDILKAARAYTTSTDPMYTCQSGYFISKKIPGQEEQSKCLDFLEDMPTEHYDDI